MITFAEHQVRAGKGGAPRDFEQMLGLLVRATSDKDASLVFANPGDWGIDVLAGSLNGQATVWQAKYFAQGIGRSQRAQIESSFATIIANAVANGFTLERWVLCTPVSMDNSSRQWWEKWSQAQQRETGVIVDLWDENALRELLLRPEAAAVHEEYYGPRTVPAPPPGAAAGVSATAAAGGDAYAAGGDLNIAGRDVNIHRGVRPKRLLLAVSGAVGLIIVVTAGGLLLAAHEASGSGGAKAPPLSVYVHSAVRTPKAWAVQVNAVCGKMNPTLVADLNRIHALPESDYGSVFGGMNPAVVQGYNKLYADYSKTDALVQQVPEPTVQNAAVNNWLTAWANSNTTLYRADHDVNGVNSDPLDRGTAAYEIDKFASETESMPSLADPVGVSECV